MPTNNSDPVDPALQAAFDTLRTRGIANIRSFPPELLALLRIDPAAPPATIHEQVRRKLLATADQLEPELRIAFLAVGGFRPGAPSSAGERLREAATQLRVSERTARRRFEKAVVQIAAILAGTGDRTVLEDIDYAFLRSRTRLDLSGKTPYITNERTISARSGGIDHVDERISLPRLRGSELNIRPLEGCTIAHTREVDPGLWAVRFAFPSRLQAGDQHSFASSIRLPDHDALEPVAGFLPHTTSYVAALELRFGDRRPAALELFATPPPVKSLKRVPGAEIIRPVNARHDFIFRKMQPGLCYGVKWHWDDEFLTDP